MKETTKIQLAWRYQKYNVMMRNYKDYQAVQTLIKQGASYKMIESAIQEILIRPIEHSAFINTFQHLWGYFKKIATSSEKERYITLLKQLDNQTISYDTCIQLIQQLTLKYEQPYLLQSAIMAD
ncbi:DUF1722 domain-containing protein [Staphylococcus intermedius]|uniref:Type II DNA modification enzyme n=1 Tax=Staphylococcus intermedius NCTC 11048 TaxID=1141106 RepID=A0A380GAA1_STAIN|nr:DUF1722 domain-containing protein [Staphylococcus intermedius]PCF65407.1 hypothetical protein B5C04_04975 [Staphylococcus intermedius]PCF81085.1 hypothetical protein B4W74_05325 [Staphylococcus intermedius]PCF82367.1 hypothetical protein B4W70_04970 [Staphylococcus intermedius]PCF87068.1 hypothetical protein B4W75_08240 [Staphylococcus intermedius]PNZ54263.1 DUF1722 domain-containing protein [Staphylococcus intermedius NCTC 11048]